MRASGSVGRKRADGVAPGHERMFVDGRARFAVVRPHIGATMDVRGQSQHATSVGDDAERSASSEASANLAGASSSSSKSSNAVRASASSVSEARVAPGGGFEEASIVVIESGKIQFYILPRVGGDAASPVSLADVQSFSFTLTPRNRGEVRRLSMDDKRMPDARARERQWAHVDRVGASARVEPASPDGRLRVEDEIEENAGGASGMIEVARGTYAIASHRDHAHLMYQLEGESDAVSPSLRRQLRVVSRASYVAAVRMSESAMTRRSGDNVRLSEPPSRPRLDGRPSSRQLTPLGPELLEREGAELVLIGTEHGHSEVDPTTAWARS